MKFSMIFSVATVLAGWTFVAAYPVPNDAEYDLEMRGEFLDVDSDSSNFWARDYDDELEAVARALMDIDDDILEARMLNALKNSFGAVKTDIVKRPMDVVVQNHRNRLESTRPPGPTPWQRLLTKNAEAKKANAPTDPKRAKAQQNWNFVFQNQPEVRKALDKAKAQKK
ncbi:hypothetical protein MD484_g2417, partial [Candolleomyces efflorescens]